MYRTAVYLGCVAIVSAACASGSGDTTTAVEEATATTPPARTTAGSQGATTTVAAIPPTTAPPETTTSQPPVPATTKPTTAVPEPAPSPMTDHTSFAASLSFGFSFGAEQPSFSLVADSIYVEGESSCTGTVELGELTLAQAVISNSTGVWYDSGSGFERTSASNPEVVELLDLCPVSEAFWADMSFGDDLGLIEGEPDVVNGIQTERIDVSASAEVLRSFGFVPELPNVEIDRFVVWIAQPGGWPAAMDVRLLSDGQELANQFGLTLGEDGLDRLAVDLRLDVRNVDDATLEVPSPG